MWQCVISANSPHRNLSQLDIPTTAKVGRKEDPQTVELRVVLP